MSAGCEARGDLEAAAAEPFAADRHGELVRLPGRVSRRHTLERDRAAWRVDRIVEVTQVTRLLAEAAGHVGVRAFLESRRGDWQPEQ